MSRLPTLLVLLSALLFGTACGYTSSLRLPEGYDSIGVEIFGNDSLEPDVERELAPYLSRSLRDLVEARLDAPDGAELVVEGRVLEYRRLGGTRGQENQLLESGVRIGIEAWLVDASTGEAVGDPVRKSVDVGYVVGGTFGEPNARERALSHLAEWTILALLRSSD